MRHFSGENVHAMLRTLVFSTPYMSPEERAVNVAAEIEALTSQEIAAFILPVLNSDEPVLPVDLEIIQKRALVLASENPALSVEDAIMNAAGDRLSAREGTETPVTITDSTGYVHAVVEKGKNPASVAREIAEDFRDHGDAASDR